MSRKLDVRLTDVFYDAHSNKTRACLKVVGVFTETCWWVRGEVRLSELYDAAERWAAREVERECL